jgi:hypothetical protein
VTVIDATRSVTVGLLRLVAVIVPFPVPEGVTVHQDESLTAVQEEFDRTVKFVFPAAKETFRLEGVTLNVGVEPVTVNEPIIKVG